jgi:hypothetical protein
MEGVKGEIQENLRKKNALWLASDPRMSRKHHWFLDYLDEGHSGLHLDSKAKLSNNISYIIEHTFHEVSSTNHLETFFYTLGLWSSKCYLYIATGR